MDGVMPWDFGGFRRDADDPDKVVGVKRRAAASLGVLVAIVALVLSARRRAWRREFRHIRDYRRD